MKIISLHPAIALSITGLTEAFKQLILANNHPPFVLIVEPSLLGLADKLMRSSPNDELSTDMTEIVAWDGLVPEAWVVFGNTAVVVSVP